jgi:hypothetical protein
MYLYVETLNARAPTASTRYVRWVQPIQHTRSLDGSGVVGLHVVELFSPLGLPSARAWILESNNVCLCI